MGGLPWIEDVTRALEQGRPERAWDRVARLWHEGPARQRHQARRTLSTLALRLPEAAWTPERRSLAKDLGIERAPAPARVGRLAFPVVGAGEGRFVEVWVRPGEGADGDTLSASLDPTTRRACEQALAAARARTDRVGALDVRFDPPDGWSGASCGLAVALAACSCLLAMPLDPLLLATGQVDLAGRVLPVGRVAEKLRLRHEARPHGRVLVAQGDDPDLPWVHAVCDLAAAADVAALRRDSDLYQALRQAQDADKQGDWLQAARLAERLVDLPDLTDAERLSMLVLLLAAGNHAADPQMHARWRARLDALLDATTDQEDLARALGSRLVGAVDSLDPAAAEAAAALISVEDFPRPLRVHLLGPLALLRTLQGRREEALELRHQALDAAAPDERPRCLGDLADALLRLGRPTQALAACEEALDAVSSSRRRHAYLARTAAYLGLHRARALVALGLAQASRQALAPALVVAGLDPALRARLLQAELDGSLAAVHAVADGLPPGVAASPLVGALVDRSLFALGDGAAAVRLQALPAFSGLDAAEAALRLPY